MSLFNKYGAEAVAKDLAAQKEFLGQVMPFIEMILNTRGMDTDVGVRKLRNFDHFSFERRYGGEDKPGERKWTTTVWFKGREALIIQNRGAFKVDDLKCRISLPLANNVDSWREKLTMLSSNWQPVAETEDRRIAAEEKAIREKQAQIEAEERAKAEKKEATRKRLSEESSTLQDACRLGVPLRLRSSSRNIT